MTTLVYKVGMTRRHAPNLDSVKWLADELWGKIRALVPCGTELHIYGAYGGASAVQELHAPVSALQARSKASLPPHRPLCNQTVARLQAGMPALSGIASSPTRVNVPAVVLIEISSSCCCRHEAGESICRSGACTSRGTRPRWA